MSLSSRSRHRTPSMRALFMSSNITDVRPVIIWQTKAQREQHDLAGLTGTGGGKSRETKDRGRGSGDGEERRLRVSKTRWTEYQATSSRGELLPRYQSKREESPPSRRRGQSCSRIRSFSRGRSMSPRKAGEPGPGILKGRSATHDGRKREGSLGWKMLRINRVDEVREFIPWPEERLIQGQGGEEIQGEELQNGVEEDVNTRQDLQLLSAKEVCGVKFDEIEMAEDDEKANDDEKVDENECSVQITITPTRRVAKIIKRKKHINSVVVVGKEKVYMSVLASSEDLAKDSDCGETTAALEQDGNNNAVSYGESPEDSTEEKSFHGYDPLLDRDPQLPVAASYDALIDQLETDDLRQSGLVEIKFSGGYESRPVQCVSMDCQATSLPSTLGLLPLPRSGHQWLCAAHSQCLLCPDPTSLTNSVGCTMCARQYHTSHLDMEEEFEDKLERELYTCKLCADPDQFTQLGEQIAARVSSSHPQQRFSSNQYPSPATKYTKIKPRPLSTPKVNPKPRPVSTSRGKPLQHSDPTLPDGWHRQLVKSSDNRWRVVVIGPDGRRFWSKSDLKKAFSAQGKEGIKWEEFNFSVFGLKRQKGE